MSASSLIILANAQTGPSVKEFYVGAAMVMGSLGLIAWVLLRFDRHPTNSFPRNLFRWGKGGWSIPASRYGAISGLLLLLVMGLMTVDFSSEGIVPKEAWIAALIFVGLYIVSTFVHDLNLYKRSKAERCRSETSPKLPQRLMERSRSRTTSG